MKKKEFFTYDPNEQLKQAWCECLDPSRLQPQLMGAFHEKVKTILDETQLTKLWSTSEIDQRSIKEYSITTIRGPLAYLEPWRGNFWRRNIAAILLKSMDNSQFPVGKNFWNNFQDQWCESKAFQQTPPLCPSHHRPEEAPAYALSPHYIEWARSEFRTLLQNKWPRLFDHVSRHLYDPSDDESMERHACALSAVSILTIADYLNLGDEKTSLENMIAYFNKDGTAIKCRFRQQSVWPQRRPRPYVDLNLSPIYAQVLVYEKEDRETKTPLLLRSMSFSGDGYEGDVSRHVRHHLIRRFDIEMAVWCEGMTRWLTHSISDSTRSSSGAYPSMNDHQDTAAFGLLPLSPHQRRWAEIIFQASSQLASSSRQTPRFAMPEDWSLDEQSTYLAQPEFQLEDGIRFMPQIITTPVLEGDHLSCNLEWDLIAPEGEWMNTHLIALIDGVPHYLEYDGPSGDGDDDAPFVMRLIGETWDTIKQRFDRLALEKACGQAVFAYRRSEFGTGAFVLGVVTLINA